MINIYLLEQILAIKNHRTLTEAAEALNITQPALTKSMKKLEDEAGVPLFNRWKKHIEINDAGMLLCHYAEKIIAMHAEMTESVRLFDRSRHVLLFGSCSLGPIDFVTNHIKSYFPDQETEALIREDQELINYIKQGKIPFAITTCPVAEEGLTLIKVGEDSLFIAIPDDDPISDEIGLYMNDLKVKSVLMSVTSGYWYNYFITHLANTRILRQEVDSMDDILSASKLPVFLTSLKMIKSHGIEGRKLIPILDKDSHIEYYCVYSNYIPSDLKKMLETLSLK